MSSALRLCLLDPNANQDPSFRPPFEHAEGVRVIDCCVDWESLQEHLNFGRLHAVGLNLDSITPAQRFLYLQRIAEVAPDVAIIGVSADSNPDVIIQAMRAGCTQFVRAPIDPEDLQDAIKRVRRSRLTVTEGCQQIAIIGSSGGAGSTTLACNLAMELSQITGSRTGLVDMDLQFGDIACAFDTLPKYSVADLCSEGAQVDHEMLETALDDLPCNVSLLSRPEDVEQAYAVSPEAVEQLFRVMGELFPFVVVDLPRYFSHVTLAAIRSSDRILIVSQLAVPFLRNASRIYQCLLQAGTHAGTIEFVINRANADHERIKADEVGKHFGRRVFHTIPNDYKHITASRDLGYPIVTTAPNAPARRAIQELARKLAGESQGAAPKSEPTRRRFFGLLRRK